MRGVHSLLKVVRCSFQYPIICTQHELSVVGFSSMFIPLYTPFCRQCLNAAAQVPELMNTILSFLNTRIKSGSHHICLKHALYDDEIMRIHIFLEFMWQRVTCDISEVSIFISIHGDDILLIYKQESNLELKCA